MQARDAYYDNAKFLLILLVVFGHFIQSYIHEDRWIYTLYITIYTFHMPAFILLAGFFAKGFHKNGYVGKITKKLILPYLIFQFIYSLYYFFINENRLVELDPFNPQWSLWFLLSLFCWNVMLFLFTKWKAGFALFLSILLGIMVGYISEISNYLSLSRTFVFFPFFLLGYYFKREHFEKFLAFKYRYISCIVLFLLFFVAYLLPEFDYRWLFGSKPYDSLEFSYMSGGAVRLGLYGISLLATLSFLALVPREQYFFTKWGTSSIYVYLLHGFFIKYFRNSELVDQINDTGQIVILVVLSILLTALLSSKGIRAISQPFIELKFSQFKKQTINSTHQRG